MDLRKYPTRLLPLYVVLATAIPLSADQTSITLRQKRDRIESILREKLAPAIDPESQTARRLEWLRHPASGTLLFTSRSHFLPERESMPEETLKLTRYFARATAKLALEALEQNAGSYAYRLLHQAHFFDPHEPISKGVVADVANSPPVVRVASTKHPRLGWAPRSYFRVTSRHYQVVCEDQQAGVKIAEQLEQLHEAWKQLFFDCWTSVDALRAACKKRRPLQPKRAKHRVVLFSSKDDYVAHLQPTQPRIDITLGFYDVRTRTSFFFAGEGESAATQLHEATHQLFQEVPRDSVVGVGRDANFWVVEGVALYMESLRSRGPYLVVGGVQSNRLQFARYRRLQEGFHVPIVELIALGRDAVQAHPEIRRIYSQSAGFIHFLMDGSDGSLRRNLMHYLRLVYRGQDRTRSLERILGDEFSQLDTRYREYLNVDDVALVESHVQPDELVTLCLARTRVTGHALRQLPAQHNMDWADLSFLPVEDDALEFMLASTELQQLSLEATRISDVTLARLKEMPTLEELDLSGTRVSDQGIRQISRLPNLRTLWLTGTQITDASLRAIAQMPSLELLECSRTQVTDAGKRALRVARPDLQFD